MQAGEHPTRSGHEHEEVVTQLSSLSQGTAVYVQDGEIGQLDCFVTDPEQNEQITHIVIRQGLIKPEYIPVPVSLVQEIREEGLYLGTTKEGLKGLSYYNWPEDKAYDGLNHEKILSNTLALRAIVADALSHHPVTKDAVIEVANDQGIITLIGTVANAHVRQTAEAISTQQSGVIAVVNSLKVKGSGDPTRDPNTPPFAPVVNPAFVER